MRTNRAVLTLAGLLSVVAITSCGSSSGSNTGVGPMMGRSSGNGPFGPGGGMMNGGSGYAYSRLTCSAPTSLPGQQVTVMLADMGMSRMMGGTAPLGARMMLRAVPATVPAGQVSFIAENMGWRTHELVVLPLAAGAAAGSRVPGSDGTVDETGSLGEASSSCAGGSGDGITSGTVGWVTLTLSPGRYELICNQPNHYADGMWQELDVT